DGRGIAELGAQARDLDLDRIRGDVVVGPGDRLLYALLGHDLADAPDQALEHHPFARGELYLALVDREPVTGEIDVHAREPHDAVVRAARAAHERAAARRELGGFE